MNFVSALAEGDLLNCLPEANFKSEPTDTKETNILRRLGQSFNCSTNSELTHGIPLLECMNMV
ncbi:hypothetical protein ACTXT7_011747 [Hymenolepis weldensis]